jgi:hypothetical protein
VQLADFEGDWRLLRDIEDRRAGRAGRFEGTARFVSAPGGLAYREEGRLRIGDGPEMAATRGYFWREIAGLVEVRFDDGRRFHAFDPRGDRPEAEHACPPDRYRVRYDFADWPRWCAEWQVAGPRKDQTILTRFNPAVRAG